MISTLLSYLQLYAPLQSAIGNGIWMGERIAYIFFVSYALHTIPGIPPHLRKTISRTRFVAALAIVHRLYWNTGIWLRDREDTFLHYWEWTENNKWITLLISLSIAFAGYWALRPLVEDTHAARVKILWFGTIFTFAIVSGLFAY